jgi:hypothetical protein
MISMSAINETGNADATVSSKATVITARRKTTVGPGPLANADVIFG